MGFFADEWMSPPSLTVALAGQNILPAQSLLEMKGILLIGVNCSLSVAIGTTITLLSACTYCTERSVTCFFISSSQ